MKNNIFTSTCDIVICYNLKDKPYGICGHLFEAVDYYHFLKKYYTVEILIGEKLTNEEINVSLSKYNVTDVKINFGKPKIINARNSILLYVDGNLNTDIVYNVKNILLFPCGIKDYTFLQDLHFKEKITMLLDKRLGYTVPNTIKSFDYNKKINFDELKKIDKKSNDILIYSTSHCKLISNKIIEKYLKITKENIVVLVNKDSELLSNPIQNKRISYHIVPYNNMYSLIGTYIYTPINRKWDCSNRMIPECKFFNINVIIDDEIDEEYLKYDKALYYRIEDSNNLDLVALRDNDNILRIIDGL